MRQHRLSCHIESSYRAWRATIDPPAAPPRIRKIAGRVAEAVAEPGGQAIGKLKAENERLQERISELEHDALMAEAEDVATARTFARFMSALLDVTGPLPLALRLQAEAVAESMGETLPARPTPRVPSPPPLAA
jgi:hypothetical protein